MREGGLNKKFFQPSNGTELRDASLFAKGWYRGFTVVRCEQRPSELAAPPF